MKKILLFLLLFIPALSMAQKVIELEPYGGVYRISCTVNGAKMKMIFDTGASSVTISKSMASYLFDNDYLSEEDILGVGQTSVANGQIVDHVVINLKDIEIDGLHLSNIKATVIDGQDAPLLLGKTALKELGTYTIEGNKLILNDYQEGLTDAEIDKINEDISSFMKSGSYQSAISKLMIFYNSTGLSPHGYTLLCQCYYAINDYNKCADYALEGLKKSEISKTDKSSLLIYAATSLEAIGNYQKSIECRENNIQLIGDDYELKMYDYYGMGNCYRSLNNMTLAQSNYRKGIECRRRFKNINPQDILQGKIRDKELASGFYFLARTHSNIYDSEMGLALTFGAMLGDNDCIKMCNSYDFDYRKVANQLYKMMKEQGGSPNIFNEDI